MVIDFTGTQSRKPAYDAAKQFQQPAIARTVDAARSCDRDLDSELRGGIERSLLALYFRTLVRVTRSQRGILVCRRVLDIAVDSDGAALHHAPDPGAGGLFDELANGDRVDSAVGLERQARLPIDRRDVVNDLDPLH